MPYHGHVEKGVVVIDEAVELREGARVEVVLLDTEAPRANPTPLRGTPYAFEHPFEPAVNESDWDMAR